MKCLSLRNKYKDYKELVTVYKTIALQPPQNYFRPPLLIKKQILHIFFNKTYLYKAQAADFNISPTKPLSGSHYLFISRWHD